MDDARDDVIIAQPFETNPRIFGVWHMYFEATFVIAACILMLTVLEINVAHRYRRSRDRVGVRTVVCYDSSDIPHNVEECCICLCNFVVGDQLASPQPCKNVYRRRYIVRALARNPTNPIR